MLQEIEFMINVLYNGIMIFVAFVLVFSVLLIILKLAALKIYFAHNSKHRKAFTIGFFHPYCNAGGGGERVLWCAIKAIQKKYPSAHCIVYSGDTEVESKDIMEKSVKTFGIKLLRNVEFVFLQKRGWVEAKRYPFLTLLGQSLGSMYLGVEALLHRPPDVYLDTMGYAFTLPIFKYIGGCRTGCYVHYPTISTDMLAVVGNQNQAFNNHPIIAKSRFLTYVKLMYYRLFAYVYGICGGCSDVVMVNSSWTLGHVTDLWKRDDVYKIFPPCDISGFLDLSLERSLDSSMPSKLILSIGQFRPEKNHTLQVEIFHDFLSNMDESQKSRYQLVLVGGCRNKGDEERVAELKRLAEKLKISKNVLIKTNISYNTLKDFLQRATIGIHTMANEHFGIGIVEFQAAGVIALAHNSGGPKMDIVEVEANGSKTGYLADTVATYSDTLRTIFNLSDEEKTEVALSARKSCKRFSEEEFEKGFLTAVSSVMKSAKKND